MDPLLVIHKCKPHLKGTLTNFFPTRTMVILAEDGIYIVGMSKDLIGSISSQLIGLLGEPAEMVGDFVGGKLSDWRSSRSENAKYVEFAADMEKFVAEQDKSQRFLYDDLEKFIYRKNMRMVVGIGNYIGFQFPDASFYFDVGEKGVVEPALSIIEQLAPNAMIKQKRGAMVVRS